MISGAEYNVGLHYFYDDLPLEVDLEKAETYFGELQVKAMQMLIIN